VALSANARTMVIGAPDYNSYTGYVEVYRTGEDGGNWTRVGNTIYGNVTGDSFGGPVDITADGTTIICGASGYHAVDRPGYVRVFKLMSHKDIGTDTGSRLVRASQAKLIGIFLVVLCLSLRMAKLLRSVLLLIMG